MEPGQPFDLIASWLTLVSHVHPLFGFSYSAEAAYVARTGNLEDASFLE